MDAGAPICDMTSHECRGCTADTECSSNVCLEEQGTCDSETDVAFVTDMGSDTGTCTRSAPCASLTFAIANLGSRKVIHVLGGTLIATNVTITGTLTLDGENTILGSTGATALNVTAPATVTIEGFRFVEPATQMPPTPAIATTGAATVTFYNIDIGGNGGAAIILGNGTTATLSHSHVGNLTSLNTHEIDCPNATLTADQNFFEKMFLSAGVGNCNMTVTRNKFDSDRDRSVEATDSELVMQNNLIIQEMGFNDSISVSNMRAGSTIRFNTIVNTTAAPSDGAALGCDASVAVTSNIFAYNSGHPIVGTGCAPRFSVFDSVSLTSAGAGNQVVSIDAIFTNRTGGDYHLAPTSVARGGAEPGQETMVKTDFDGNSRPDPVGSTSDCGAFEAP
jgi:hypothetical protein